MKIRYCGKIIKHKERYSAQQIQSAYDRLTRSLRKYYMRKYLRGEGMTNYYCHMACRPCWEMWEDINDLWNVSDQNYGL